MLFNWVDIEHFFAVDGMSCVCPAWLACWWSCCVHTETRRTRQ